MNDIYFVIKKNKISVILVYSLVVSFCYILPLIKYSIPYIPLAIILLASYFFTVKNWSIDKKTIFPIIVSSLSLGIMSFWVMRQGNISESINETVRSLRFFAPYILYLTMFEVSDKNKRIKNMRIYTVFISCLIIYIMFQTLNALKENAMIARILAMGVLNNDMSQFRLQNVGGFEFSYSVGFVAVFLWYVFLTGKNIKLRYFAILGYFFIIYFIFKTQYMTLLLLTVTASVILWYCISSKGLSRFIAAFGCLFFMLMLPTLFHYLGTRTNVEESVLIAKFMQLSEFFSGKELDVLGSRPRLYANAFRNFMNSPIWGNITEKNGVVLAGMATNHSTLLGYLQGMGIIGGVLFYFPIYLVMKRISLTFRHFEDSVKILWNIICMMFIILSILNPIQYCFEICFIVFLYIPCVIQSIKES